MKRPIDDLIEFIKEMRKRGDISEVEEWILISRVDFKPDREEIGDALNQLNKNNAWDDRGLDKQG